ncbi:hypothetical protein GF337_00140 [candidate division KSB1 bacterium]|nr:hypothetical protein [candidate division KSB1 bacterium]
MIEDLAREQIENVGKKFETIAHCDHILLIDKNGQIASHNFVDEQNAMNIRSVMRKAIMLTNKFSREGRFGKHKDIVLEGDFGKIMITNAPISGYFIALIGSINMNSGMIHAMIEESGIKSVN